MESRRLRLAVAAGVVALAALFVGVLGSAGTIVLGAGLCSSPCDVADLLADVGVGEGGHEVCVHGHGCAGGATAGHGSAPLALIAAGIALPVLGCRGRLRSLHSLLSGWTLARAIDHPPRAFA